MQRTFGELTKFAAVAPVTGSELWVLAADGTPYHLTLGDTSASGRPLDQHEDEGEVESLKMFWDGEVIRGLRLTMRGATGASGESTSFGDVDPSLGLGSTTHTFAPGDRLATARIWTGTTTGGSVRRIELTTLAGKVSAFGNEASGEPVALTVRGSVLCGLYGRFGSNTRGAYLASLGFWVRGEAAAADVLEHLNDNAPHYSRVIWAHADELELSRMLATYRYTPRGESAPIPLAVRLDPRPVAMTGNYLAFRWHFANKRERKRWLRENVDRNQYPDPIVLGLPSRGVFAEAVLGRANSAEKLDLTRFWNWQDSPLPMQAGEIAPVSTESRARDVDLAATPLADPAARINPLQPLPAPTGLDATLRTVATANLFRDMSGLAGAQDMLTKGLELAAANDQAGGRNATEAMKIATEHLERMTDLAIDALPMLLGPEGALLAGMAGGGGGGGAGIAKAVGENISQYGAYLNSGVARRGDDRGGHRRAGSWGSDDRRTGSRASRDRRTDDWGSGNQPAATWTSGERRTDSWGSGEQRTGDWESGERRTGDWGSGERRTDGWGAGERAGGSWGSRDRRSEVPVAERWGPPQEWIDRAWARMPEFAQRYQRSIEEVERRFRQGLADGAFDDYDQFEPDGSVRREAAYAGRGPTVEDVD